MNRIVYSSLCCALLCAACATADPDEEAAAETAQQQDTLSGPTITRGGDSAASVISSFHGARLTSPGLEIRGSTSAGAYLTATYRVSASSDTASQVTVTPASGASFVFMMLGSGSRYTTQQLRLQRIPGSSQLQAQTASGNVDCGALPSGASTRITLTLRPASHSFDVQLGGVAGGCTALPLVLQLPVVGVAMMDASNEGYGGQVDFTDLSVF